MSLRNRLIAPAILSTLAILSGCGGGGSGITNPVAPPTGSFSNSNLNGTYVFSVSGADFNGAPYALVGTFAANGSGGISSGAYDMNDAEFPSNNIAPVADQSITGGNYSVQVDGRTRVTLNTSTPFSGGGGASGITLDLVLQDSSHGLVTQFDSNGTGSGTVDLQTSGVTPTGTYAFSLSGATVSLEALAAVGNFTVGSTGIAGLIDVNEGGILSIADNGLSGSLTVGPSASPATTLSSGGLNGTFDVFAIDATHLKLIEMDTTNILIGDAYSQTSSTMPAGTLAFTLAGCNPCNSTTFNPEAMGGFMVTDASGNVTSASSEDYNVGGTSNSSSGTFSASYTPTSSTTGRYELSGFSSFAGGNTYAAYPSSGGLLLLEIDSVGLSLGAAYPQTSSASFAASQGYALNLFGTNLNGASSYYGSSGPVEIDDIAEFGSAASGGTVSGVIDENYAGGSPNYGLALSSGTYSGPDSSGRYSLSAAAGNQNNSTLNGGFNLLFYTADGVTFPFIEVDNGQVATGVFVQQSSSAASSAAIKSTMFMAPPIFRGHVLKKKQK
ncbi:MAG TPA: hypothetical protein VE866_03730 [Candidatus Binatia bacterium]|nr:hypothetical protein [Candidatus Binatia bacterium]